MPLPAGEWLKGHFSCGQKKERGLMFYGYGIALVRERA